MYKKRDTTTKITKNIDSDELKKKSYNDIKKIVDESETNVIKKNSIIKKK